MLYLKKVYTVCVSTYQMAVLMAYNQGDTHSMTSLSQLTQLPGPELATTVQSLLDSKILECVVEGTKADHSTAEPAVARVLRLNMNYANKRTKFKITAIFQKDSQQVCTHSKERRDND